MKQIKLKDGLCPSCREYDEGEYEDYEEYEDFEEYEDCPKCGRSYNEIDRDVQWCSKCGYDPEKKKFLKPVEPTRSDYEEGEADILTGRWY